MFTSQKQWLVIAALSAMSLASCTSNDSEDDQSMEVEEPVDAAPEESGASTPSPAESTAPSEPSTSPEATPSSSVATQSAPSPAPEAAPVAGSSSVSSSMRVMYVKFDGVALREKPDAKSKKVGKLNRGDHRLVAVEGEWARTQDGKYIAMKSLSERGIGPNRKGAQWSGGSAAPESDPSAQPSVAPAANENQPPKKLPKKTKSSAKKKAADTAKPAEPGDGVSTPEVKSETPAESPAQ